MTRPGTDPSSSPTRAVGIREGTSPMIAAGAPAELDLSNCAREPIRTPGSIQPHGMLLTLGEHGLEVLQVSRNAREMLGVEAEAVLGRPVDAVLGADLARDLREAIAGPSLGREPLNLSRARVEARGGRWSFDALLHRSGDVLVLELEPSPTGNPAPFRDLYPMVRNLLSRLEGASGVAEVCGLAAAEVRRITGVDRVLIYRFDEGWNGTVVAEVRNEALPSYLGHRFPASDIPEQARALYRANRLRLIPDSGYEPVPLVPGLDPTTGRPLDLGFATLRSVSPLHVEYMNNMGTGSSMSISILDEGELWGLISCHNREPRLVPFDVRTACDLVGQVLSLQVAAKARHAEYEHRIGREAAQSRLLAEMTEGDDFVEGLLRRSDVLLDLVEAAGAAILHDGHCTLTGATPDEEQVGRIADWLDREPRGDPFATDSLASAFPDAEAFQGVASGLLAIATSRLHRGYLLWFRPEVIGTVTWGGDPRKPAVAERDGRIHPRKSFEAWKEIVRLRSSPWRPSEVEAAANLRNAIVGVVLRRAEERAQLVAELERSNKELEAFSYSVSHDLRAPFRHIVGYSELLRETSGAHLDDDSRRYLETIIESAQYAGTLVDNLLAFSRMGRTAIHRMPIDMNSLARRVIAEVMAEADGRRVDWEVGDLPPVEGDPMMIRLVLSNLASNAVKYTRPRERAEVAISAEAGVGEFVFSVRDNGVGFDMKYADKLFGVFQRLHRMEEFEGTGIGLANVRRIVSRHGGRAWAEGELDRGATFFFALPRHPASARDTPAEGSGVPAGRG